MALMLDELPVRQDIVFCLKHNVGSFGRRFYQRIAQLAKRFGTRKRDIGAKQLFDVWVGGDVMDGPFQVESIEYEDGFDVFWER